MKKITLLNFPFTYYEPIRKTGDMNHTFFNINTQKDEKKIKELKEMREKKEGLELKIAELSIKAAGYKEDPAVIEYEAKSDALRKAFADEYDYCRKKQGEELRDAHFATEPEIRKFGRKLESAQWDLERLVRDIQELEEPMNANIPFIHTPLQQKHINLMNREIAKRAHEGWEMDSYKLLETEFFNDYKDLQKCYSGVLFTWIRTREKGNHHKVQKSGHS